MNQAKRCSFALLGLVAALSLSVTAHAEDEFPGVIENHLSLSYQPPCSVCHLKENTGAPTARTLFALSLKARDSRIEARSPPRSIA